jgi:hypothetical protein
VDSTEATYGLTPPGLDGFGGLHYTGDEDPDLAPAWTGDPSSMPLPVIDGDGDRFEHEAVEFDRAIYAALVAG